MISAIKNWTVNILVGVIVFAIGVLYLETVMDTEVPE